MDAQEQREQLAEMLAINGTDLEAAARRHAKFHFACEALVAEASAALGRAKSRLRLREATVGDHHRRLNGSGSLKLTEKAIEDLVVLDKERQEIEEEVRMLAHRLELAKAVLEGSRHQKSMIRDLTLQQYAAALRAATHGAVIAA
jgi:hypothetical protein